MNWVKVARTEAEMIKLGQAIAQDLPASATIELVGDVGTGKTTISKGIAQQLGVQDEITSPSFVISKRYDFMSNDQPRSLVHYDFYRLPEPGIMQEELIENLQDPTTIVIIEWGNSVVDFLPADRHTFHIQLNDDGSRTVKAVKPGAALS